MNYLRVSKKNSNFSEYMAPERLFTIEEPRGSKVELNKEIEKSVCKKILRNFLIQNFPLSEAGLILKEKVENAIKSDNEQLMEELLGQVPTVENPHPELFGELLLGKEEVDDILGEDLANIQITKGCSHGCDFCAAGAEKKINVMPFAAIVKIVESQCDEEKTKERERRSEMYISWRKKVLEETGIDIKKTNDHASNGQISNQTAEKIWDLFTQDPLYHFLKEIDYKVPMASNKRFVWGLSSPPGWYKNPDASRLMLRWARCLFGVVTDEPIYSSQITNYYDSDPFDYRDNRLLHADGTPAHFGDVVEKLSSLERPIHITTAGWVLNNLVAQKAAEKIVALYKEDSRILSKPRISINRTQKTAKKDPEKYLKMMKNVIFTLRDINPQILLFDRDDEEFKAQIGDHIRDYINELGVNLQVHAPVISSYSGTITEFYQQEEDDHDVMACMPGYHIWPDGTVAEQKYGERKGSAPKGSRPTDTGKKLF
ncbi:MAG: hypothetical protein CL685_04265 [Candidatus Magasanikbacteria bacterium]|nr:hypothetical protein [Candidatus Magasanikbacteria bacterium]